MFYRRKLYIVKNDFVDILNEHFNKTNLPNQLKYGARLVGRWMVDLDDETTEVFAIWEYDSYDAYSDIERRIRSDKAHLQRIHGWYEQHGGKDQVRSKFLEVRNEPLKTTS